MRERTPIPLAQFRTTAQEEAQERSYYEALNTSADNDGTPTFTELEGDVLLVIAQDESLFTRRMSRVEAKLVSKRLEESLTRSAHFGRFTFFGRLWGLPYVWSTTDPPNYGATIGIDLSGNCMERTGCNGHEPPTDDEIRAAQYLVTGHQFDNHDTETDLEVPSNGVEPA